MREDDIGSPLERLIVAPFESVPFFRWAYQRPHFRQEVFNLHGRRFCLSVQEFVHSNYELREGVEPGKPGIVEDELQQLTC
jgi:hypothetical protein